MTKAHPPAPIRDPNGDPVTEPVLMDGKGDKLAANKKPVFLKFKTKELGSYNNLLNKLR